MRASLNVMYAFSSAWGVMALTRGLFWILVYTQMPKQKPIIIDSTLLVQLSLLLVSLIIVRTICSSKNQLLPPSW